MPPYILHEDNHLLVANKPAGILTQPSGTEQESLEAICKAWLKEKYGKPGNVFLEAVHRLDKPVSGIVLFAKTSKALSRLQASQRAKEGSKNYLALLEGIPHKKEGKLEHFLVHGDFQAFVDPKHPDSKHSILHYRLLEERNGQALVEIDLVTGRYHQIRAQFAAEGMPIVGDKRYGGHGDGHKICLHHFRLTFSHPISHELLTFESQPDWGLKF